MGLWSLSWEAPGPQKPRKTNGFLRFLQMQVFGYLKLSMALLGSSWPLLGPIWSQNGPQNGPKSGPKSAQKLVQKMDPKITPKMPVLGPKMAPKLGSKRPTLLGGSLLGQSSGARWPQDGPKMAQDAQDAPKMAPRWPKIAPRWAKMPPRCPKMPPRWLQDAPKWPQDGPKMAPNAYHEAPLATFLLSRAGGMRGAIEFGRSPALAWAPCQDSQGQSGRFQTVCSCPKTPESSSMTPAHSAGPSGFC
jgi:hypothetical protein